MMETDEEEPKQHKLFHRCVSFLFADDPRSALEAAQESLRIDPDFVAGTLLARLLFRCYPRLAPDSSEYDVCDRLTQTARLMHRQAQIESHLLLQKAALSHVPPETRLYRDIAQINPHQVNINPHAKSLKDAESVAEYVVESDFPVPIIPVYPETLHALDTIGDPSENAPFSRCFSSVPLSNPSEDGQAMSDGKSTEGRSIGTLYIFLYGYYLDLVIQDQRMSFRLYSLSTYRGLVYAEIFLGWCFYNGYGTKRDETAASRWFARGAAAGFPNALNLLGVCHTLGRGGPKKEELAYKCYEKAALMRYPDAAYNLSLCLYHGHGVARNREDAVSWLRLAAQRGFGEAQSLLGSFFFHGDGSFIAKDSALALHWARRAAEQGEAEASLQIAMAYFHGDGVNRDISEAIRWVHRAMGSVGDLWELDTHPSFDSPELTSGNSYAPYLMAFCYQHGSGVRMDLRLARAWAILSASRGCPEAKKLLSQLVIGGRGGTCLVTDIVKLVEHSMGCSDLQEETGIWDM